MRLVELTLGPLAAADADAIAESQTPAGGGAQDLTLNGTLVSGGVATLDAPRRVAIASAGDDSGRTFTVYGTDRNGIEISEVLTGPNAASVGTLSDFKTVTRVSVDDNTAGAITVGTNVVASTPWIPVDQYRNPINVGIHIVQDGTATWDIEHTFDEVYREVGPYETGKHDTLVDKTASDHGNYIAPIAAFRLTTTAYTNPATIKVKSIQAGVRGG